MKLSRLPFRATLADFSLQAAELLEAWRAGDADALEFFRQHHPRFRDEEVKWVARHVPVDDLRAAAFQMEDAQLAVARWYDFRDWDALSDWVHAVSQEGSQVERFESAVEAVVHGDTAILAQLLAGNPDLVRARSTRVAPFDPPMHQATLLHYIAANGVEGYRQITPPNAVEVATLLLEAGADSNALAGMYGGQHATIPMLVSSAHPANAGLQVPLVDILVDYGGSVEAVGTGDWTSPLLTALAFGYLDAAEALVRRGALIRTLSAAAGLGRLEDVQRLLPTADVADRHRALALAAQLGHAEVVRLLLDAGEDPNRYNPKGTHSHSTPLHQAVWSNHMDVVKLLVERGARLDIEDTVWHGTPLGWAEHGERQEMVEYLRRVQGSTV
jgi:ankyrin repeat protein